jgi:hypothetical protein
MTSHATRAFWKAFRDLPLQVQRAANAAYRRWRQDPFYPSLEFKELEGKENVYSVRIGLGWRALANKDGDSITWFWIGSHAEYDRLIR